MVLLTRLWSRVDDLKISDLCSFSKSNHEVSFPRDSLVSGRVFPDEMGPQQHGYIPN